MFETDIKGSEFSDFSLLTAKPHISADLDVVQIAYQKSLHKILSSTVNVSLKEQLYCKPINARLSAIFFVTNIGDTLRRQIRHKLLVWLSSW